METARLLSEFSPVSTEQWEQAIRETVVGPEYPAKLIWHPEEGLAVRPYYRAEDLDDLQFLSAGPGDFPYVRGTRTTGDWRIREEVRIKDPEEANRVAREAIAAGAEEIAFRSTRIGAQSDVSVLLANLDEIPVHFEAVDQVSVRILAGRLSRRSAGTVISADLDPLSDLEFSAEMIRTAPAGFRPFCIHANEYEEQGAGAIEQIGFAASAAVDFLDEMQKQGAAVDRAASSVVFSFAIGPDFFVQIAKLRAFRMVWAQIMESFGADQLSAKSTVHARTAQWNKTVYDPCVNILRATTEAISAVLGGADSVTVGTFDECYTQGENARRLARNTQLILKLEAQLARVVDPVGGSYLIESLTNGIATKAWRLFQELESAGGYQKARTEGVIASVIERRDQARQDAINRRRLVLTGTNRFVNTAEKAPEKANIQGVRAAKRVSQGFEELRMRTERAAAKGKSLRILLAQLGDAKMRTARSQFAADFLACAGLTTEVKYFENAEQIAAVITDAIVLCSSDAEYLTFAERIVRALNERPIKIPVLIAGNPETREQLKASGVWGFIHLKSDAVDVLQRLQEAIGIES